MPNGIKKAGKGAPVAAALVVVVVMAMLTVAVISCCFAEGEDRAVLIGMSLFYAVICGAVAIGVIAALVQRLRELRGGEEDEARKY